MESFETIFLILVMIFVAFSMRIIAMQERIAHFRLGRYVGLKGPGVVMIVPYLDRACKICIGDRGELMEDGTGRFGEFQVPVESPENIAAGASIRVVGFAQNKIQVA